LVKCKSSIELASPVVINEVALSAFSLLTYVRNIEDADSLFPSYLITSSSGTNDLSTFSTYLHELENAKNEYISGISEHKTRVELEAKDRQLDNALAKWKMSTKWCDDKLPDSHIKYILSMLDINSEEVSYYTYLLSTPTMVLCFAPKFNKNRLNDLIDLIMR
jgi:hypothetical protein